MGWVSVVGWWWVVGGWVVGGGWWVVGGLVVEESADSFDAVVVVLSSFFILPLSPFFFPLHSFLFSPFFILPRSPSFFLSIVPQCTNKLAGRSFLTVRRSRVGIPTRWT
jgi:hypothetical protein